MKYEPKFGRVLIEREVKRASGLIIPESAAKRNAPCVGKIVALGESAGWTEAYENGESKTIQTMNVGDSVLFGRHAGAWIDGEETLFICQDEDILAVIKE
jgi:co-chaperonin GroES (HSP10)